MCRSGSDDRQDNYYKDSKNLECYISKKNQETNIATLEIILNQLHSTKEIFQIAQSLIRDPTTDTVTWKNICTLRSLIQAQEGLLIFGFFSDLDGAY